MNVPSQKELLQLFDQQQHDHPIGGIASRYVEQALKKHPDEKKQRKKKSQIKPKKPESNLQQQTETKQ